MNDSAELLKELRIERSRTPAPPPSRRGLWIGLAVAAVLALAVVAWLLSGASKPVAVETAPVAAVSGPSNCW